jgi:hypothetical protein
MALIYDPDAGTYYDDGTDDDDAVTPTSAPTDAPTDTPTATPTAAGSGGILDAFKGIWDRFKSGTSNANDLQAGLALLNLLAPSLSAPKTAGWKGSIDMNRQFTRTPLVNPSTQYKPYSGQPVMGQQYFNTFYGAAPTAPGGGGDAAGGGNTGTVTPIGTDPNSPGDTGGRAHGGLLQLARGGEINDPRYLQGQTDGMADEIPSDIDGVQPAKLSHGEFVIPADVVSHLGNGNSEAGAEVLYKMMDRVREARTGNKEQGKQINPEKFTPGGIAGYAGGGAVAFTTGGLAPTAAPTIPVTPTSLGTSSEANISEWAGPYVGDMLSKTVALTNQPYQAYTGPLSAGYSALQNKVFTGLQGLSFPGQLGQSFSASGAYQLPTDGGPATGGGGIASQYMNPYLSAVLTPQLEELRRQSQITQLGNASKATQAGAFGGSRQAIMDAETQRNLLQEQNKAIGTGYANAYDKAMGQFNTEQGQARTLAEMMSTAGGQQRDIEQQGITESRKQFEAEQMKPYTDLRFQREMLSGLPVATQATTPNTSTMGQLTGGLSALEKALKDLGITTG